MTEMNEAAIPAELRNAIAVVGMAGRFPSAPTIEHFWENLCSGAELITFFSDEELVRGGVAPALLQRPDYVRAKAVLDAIDSFDAELFGISPREAALMDPQHRLFLECAWEALEDAARDPWTHPGRIGIFASAGKNTYLLFNLLAQEDWSVSDEVFQLLIGNEKDYLATRVSHLLNLTGPSMTVQTACSSSLVAVHLACQSLLMGECDVALAGGVSVDVPREAGYLYRSGGILSPDGHCRPYDLHAAGTVFGHGMGIVVLRRAEDAWRDGDHVRALIRGSAVNNDGARRVGFTAPSIEGQAAVIAEALAVAEVSPGDIGYVEGHGTATHVGDAVEIGALQRVFRAGHRGRPASVLGSMKSNAGHLGAAAGIGGFIKAVLAVQRGVIPPTLHFTEPHPLLDTAGNPFRVNRELETWEHAGAPRRAAVSSFGQGGTNAHVIVEEPPSRPERPGAGSWQVLPLSARTPGALEALRRGIDAVLDRPRFRLEDIAYSLQVGRRALPYRGAILARMTPDGLCVRGAGSPGDRQAGDEPDAGARELANRWIGGERIDWSAWSATGSASRVPLPTYPFERKRYWIEPVAPHRLATVAPEPVAHESIEAAVAHVFQSVLGLEHVGVHDDFFALGGHSLLEPEIRSRLAALGYPLSQGVLWEHPTAGGLAELIRHPGRGDRDREAVILGALSLDDEIHNRGVRIEQESPPGNVLLTGVTGLLGAHLLCRLLETTEATIHCLLRADSVESAVERIRRTLATYALDGEQFANRIVAIPADLSRHRLGLAPSVFDRLADAVDVIYHAGANVNFVQPYSVLKTTNVNGVHEVLRLTARSRVKPLHYVSSVAVFESDSFASIDHVLEDEDIGRSAGFHNGYDLSKLAAERLVTIARGRGLSVSLYRLSNIAGHSRTGIILPQHIFACLVKGCVQLQAAPGEDDVVNVLPVDTAAAALVDLSLKPESLGMNFHVVNPVQTRIRALIEWLRERGFRIDAVPYEEWRQRLHAAPLDNAFKPFLGLLDQGRLFTNRSYDAANVRRFSVELDHTAIDELLLDRYLDYWKRTGFL
jgi:thioester reductase-like protein